MTANWLDKVKLVASDYWRLGGTTAGLIHRVDSSGWTIANALKKLWWPVTTTLHRSKFDGPELQTMKLRPKVVEEEILLLIWKFWIQISDSKTNWCNWFHNFINKRSPSAGECRISSEYSAQSSWPKTDSLKSHIIHHFFRPSNWEDSEVFSGVFTLGRKF